MSNKIASIKVLFEPIACNTALICSPQVTSELRQVADKSLKFAQHCRLIFSEVSNVVLNMEIGKVEAISKAYDPDSFMPYGVMGDQQMPVHVARRFLDGAPVIRDLAQNVIETRDGRALLLNMTTWQDLRKQMSRSGNTISALRSALHLVDDAKDAPPILTTRDWNAMRGPVYM